MSANLVGTFYARQRGHEDRPALIWDGSAVCSFGELPGKVGQFRAALVELGVRRGDRVMLKAVNSPEFVLLYLAVLSLGAIFVPMNTSYTASEVQVLVEDAAPRLIVHASGTAVPEPAGTDIAYATLEADGSGSLPALARSLEPDLAIEAVGSDDLAAILFTSGTTGRPKGATLTHGNLASNVASLYDIWRFSAQDVILHSLPLFHAHGLFVAFHLGMFSAATLLMLPKFEAASVMARLADATVFMGVPTFYARLLDHPGLTREACEPIRLFISGSAPLLPSVFDAFEARTGHRMMERYGMTEALMITSNPYPMEARLPGTVGYPLRGVSLRIVDQEGREIAPGEIGEIEIRGPNICTGYWRRPEATAESFLPDGYFRTGDTGFKDTDGRVTIAGRSKDLIISGGYNVYPAEIEIMIAEVGGVVDVAVFGVPHPDFGEAVLAAVTVDGAGFDQAALDRVVAERLAKFKQPKQVFVLDEFPRNAMGKILKAELRGRYRDTFS